MDEVILSGYCRCLDGARTVVVELEDGKLYADCAFGNCPHEGACALAESMREILKREA